MGDEHVIPAAYFVVGAESSGTRMAAEWIIRHGIVGESGHQQTFDDWECVPMAAVVPRILIRRSLPHGDVWPDESMVVAKLAARGYPIRVVATHRETFAQLHSQVKAGHATDLSDASERSTLAAQWLMDVTAVLPAVHIQYEEFIHNHMYRLMLRRLLNLHGPVPEMDLWDANQKYYEDMVVKRPSK